MFTNIGHKIKILAKVLCWLGILSSVIIGVAGIVLASSPRSASYYSAYYRYTPTVLGSVLIMIGGILFSWTASFFAYGFGELIERAANIDEKMGDHSNLRYRQ